MENPIKMDDLGVPLFLETPIYIYYIHIGCGPLPATVANEGLFSSGFPFKHVIILMVTVTGRGPQPIYTLPKTHSFCP